MVKHEPELHSSNSEDGVSTGSSKEQRTRLGPVGQTGSD